MAKTRVYELAKEFSLDSRELVFVLNAKGYGVKNYMSTIADEACGNIRQFLRCCDASEFRKLIDHGREARTKWGVVRRRRPKVVVEANESVSEPNERNDARAAYSKEQSSIVVQESPEVKAEKEAPNAVNTKIQGKTFVVDGLNIIRSYSRRKGYVSFEALLTILLELRRNGGAFICIFDANTWYELGKKGKAGSDARYAMLRERLPDEFVEVPGGNKADQFILLQAEKNGCLVISNDRFKDYEAEYSWLKWEGDCLFKGTAIRQHIEMPDLKISVPIRKDIDRMTTELISQLENN